MFMFSVGTIIATIGLESISTSARTKLLASCCHVTVNQNIQVQAQLEKDRIDFQKFQANRDFGKGDEILHRYVVDKKWAYRQCRKLFAVGWSRYSKLKSGKPFETIIARGGGRLTSYDSCYRHVVYLAFAKYLEKCLRVDQAGKHDVSVFLIDRHGNPFKPNYRKWGYDYLIYEDYLLFVDAFSFAKKGHCVKAFSPSSFVKRIKDKQDIQYGNEDLSLYALLDIKNL